MTELLNSLGYNHWILPVLLGLPLAGAVLVLVRGWLLRPAGATDADVMVQTRQAALWVFILEAVLSLGLWWSVNPGTAGWTARVDWAWIPNWGIRFDIGVDGIATMLILLTTLLMPLAVLGGWTSIREKTAAYYALLMVLTTGMLGVFMALDLVLFYTFWELMLVPMYLIIGVWGGQRRLYASMKFFVYTMVGSLLMLVAIIYLGLLLPGGNGQPMFGYDYILHSVHLNSTQQLWLFAAFALAFMVKVPMWPFHTWLPDAHVEAPTAGSVILAAIMLKMGTFGFIRYALPLFPNAAMNDSVRALFLTLAVIGIVYGALVALVQPDFKKLVAYSSVSHLGFVMLGLFALTTQSVQGALMVNLSHGVSTGALFLMIGMVYERRHTRLIADYGGIAAVTPVFATLLTIVCLSSIGVPGTNGFVGEFLVLIGTYRTQPVFAIIAATAVIFAAAYMLWALQRIIYNPLIKPENKGLTDLNRREIALLIPLIAAIVWMGVYPKPVLEKTQAAASRLVRHVESGGNADSGPPMEIR